VYNFERVTFGELKRDHLDLLEHGFESEDKKARFSTKGEDADAARLTALLFKAGVTVVGYASNIDDSELCVKAFAELQRVVRAQKHRRCR
jgi:hypothetical protein